MSEARLPFDPTDPFDVMCEQFRTLVVDMVLEAGKTTIYRDLGPQKQLECFLSGVLVGAIGVAFASVERQGREVMMEYLTACLPIARQIAEEIMDQRPGAVRTDAGVQ